MRGKGEGAVFRVPKDTGQPLKYWQASIELPPVDGNRRRKVLRSKDKQKLLRDLRDKQKELAELGDLPTATMSVEQWFGYWLREVVTKNVRPKTATDYESMVRLHIMPALGPKTRLDKITPAKIRDVHNRIVDSGRSSTLALNAHRIMSTSFEVAVREGKVGRNPAKLVSAPKKSKPKLDVYTLPEATRVLEQLSLSDDPLAARWAMAMLTGARRGEVIGLQRDRVTEVLDLSWQLQRLKLTERTGRPVVPADFEYEHLTGGLYLTRPKSSAGWRVIPLAEPLRSILLRHLEAAPDNAWGLVFTNQGRPIDPDTDSRMWRERSREFGIDKNVRLHDLRHGAADLLYLAGVPEDLIPKILGHSTRAMSRAYTSEVDRERLTAAMQQVGALFQRLAS